MPAIGFVILVNPFSPLEQTSRLIHKLNEMFDCPPIACHFDFGKNPAELPACPPNVKIVRPHVDTKWADFSCIEAAIGTIRLLYAGKESPDWFVYLSGADYPIKSAERILFDLKNSSFDAHIEHLAVENKLGPENPILPRPEGYKGRSWPRDCFRRFCNVPVAIPWLTRKMSLTKRILRPHHRLFTFRKLPFTKSFKCYAGEAWWCANRKSAFSLLNFHDRDQVFARHCRQILVPEECYFQTVLANDPELRLSQNYFRYVDWTGGGSHPKLITSEDLPAMQISDAHFARKINYPADPALLHGLDSLTG